MMTLVLAVLGGAQLFYGLFVFSVAESAMHEIFAATLFGFGSVCIGLAGILYNQPGRD